VTKTGRGLPNPMFGYGSGHLRAMVRGYSADHASIQLADLVAGLARRCALPPQTGGQCSQSRRVPCTGRGALITANGLFAQMEPIRFGSPSTPAGRPDVVHPEGLQLARSARDGSANCR